MFTGIINQTCSVAAIEKSLDFMRFAVKIPATLCKDLQTGASVAVDGCCQTVTQIDTIDTDNSHTIWFDAMQETLRRTTLGSLSVGHSVNIERAAVFGQEVGGHELSGHVDDTIVVENIEQTSTNHIITLSLPKTVSSYVFNKGYLGIHGASLTVSDLDRDNNSFKVYLIPETLKMTNLGQCKKGDRLNLEIDRRTQVIVDTVRATLAEMKMTDV